MAGLAADLYKEQTIVDMAELVSPYSSLASLTREIYSFVPQALLCYPLRSDQVIDQIKKPQLLSHGE